MKNIFLKWRRMLTWLGRLKMTTLLMSNSRQMNMRHGGWDSVRNLPIGNISTGLMFMEDNY